MKRKKLSGQPHIAKYRIKFRNDFSFVEILFIEILNPISMRAGENERVGREKCFHKVSIVLWAGLTISPSTRSMSATITPARSKFTLLSSLTLLARVLKVS